MRSSSANVQPSSNRIVSNGRSTNWVWWGVVGAVAAIVVLSLVAVLLRGSAGVGRNRGPASEAAPGNRPSQDIDRSRAR
jgi:hypothetical protein